MANTLKFGNENWATKKDSILAYNDENANFKPLPFVTSRASTATRVNKAGLLETVASGVPRVDYLDNSKGSYLLEPASTNLITQSEAFGNSYWTKSGATIQGDASTAGNEKVTGTDADFSGAGNWISTAATLTTAYNSGDAGHSTTLRIESDNTASDRAKLSINWTKGVIYKITFDYKVISGTSANIDVANNLAVSSDNALQSTIWTTKTIYFTADVTGANLLQIYSSRSGSATDELLIDNVSVKEVQGFSAPSADSPLGAFKLVEGTNNGSHFLYSANAGGSVGNLITTSFFAKASERSWCKILGYDGSAVWFDLTNGVIGTETSAKGSIESLSDGWYKISSTYTSSDASKEKGYLYMGTADGVDGYTGDGTSGVYIFGAQVEQQSYATSYIPNYGESAGVTRLVDTAIGAGNASTFNSTEGVLFWEGSFDSTSTTPGAIALIGAGSNRVQLYNSGTSIVALIQVNGIVVFNQTTNGTIPIISNHKYAIKYALNDFALWIDGIEIGISASGSTFGNSALTELRFSDFGTGYLFANTKQLQYFNTALTDAELIALTTI